VEERITLMEQALKVNDAVVAAALEAVGLDRPALERAIYRVLVVQAAMEDLNSQGHNLTAWLQEQRDIADILIFEDVAVMDLADAQAIIATQVAQSAPAAPTETPSPTPAPTPVVVKVAPDFTLERAGGGTFALAEQLAEGPLVMVFFQKCG
jgi:hypothetical protein